MSVKTIVCTNNDDNLSVDFAAGPGYPWIESIDGIYGVKNNLSLTDYATIDGSYYSGSLSEKRNIVINGHIAKNNQSNRDLMYRTFRPRSHGTFNCVSDGVTKEIDYVTESINFSDNDNPRIQDFTLSLICPDPFFRGSYDITVVMAGWKGNFIFPHRFKMEAIGSRQSELLKDIINDNGASDIGMTIAISCIGSISNPYIEHVENDQRIAVNVDLVQGDLLEIITNTGTKSVYLTHDGVRTNIDVDIDVDSEFIQLRSGHNSLRYGAASGQDFMSVSVTYRMRYLGI